MKALNLLKVLAHTSWGADRVTLLNLYRSLIRSKLDYGSVVYGSARKSYLQKLDTIHHQGLRLALGAFQTSPVTSLYVEADEPSLALRREKLALQYAIRLAAYPNNTASKTTYPSQFSDLYESKPHAIKPFGLRILPLLEGSKIHPKNIQEHDMATLPSWCIKKPTVLFDLHNGKKSDDDEFRFNDASTHEGHLRQNGELTWFCSETIIMISHKCIKCKIRTNLKIKAVILC